MTFLRIVRPPARCGPQSDWPKSPVVKGGAVTTPPPCEWPDCTATATNHVYHQSVGTATLCAPHADDWTRHLVLPVVVTGQQKAEVNHTRADAT